MVAGIKEIERETERSFSIRTPIADNRGPCLQRQAQKVWMAHGGIVKLHMPYTGGAIAEGAIADHKRKHRKRANCTRSPWIPRSPSDGPAESLKDGVRPINILRIHRTKNPDSRFLGTSIHLKEIRPVYLRI